MQIGFAILTHQLPDQAMRLTRTLDRMFPGVRIVIHHDFSKCEFPVEGWAQGVSFVRPHVETRWGRMGLVDAEMAALSQLAGQLPAEAWMVLLSGSDYPLAPAPRILDDYRAISEDALLDYREVTYEGFLRSHHPDGRFSYDSNAYQQVAYDRYMAIRIPYPSWRRPWERKAAGAVFLRHPAVVRWFTPFHGGVRCYSGSQWFSIRAGAFQKWHGGESYSRWRRYFARRHIPDEVMMQTGLLNDSRFRVKRTNLRYVDWSQGGSHPRELGLQDLDAALASGSHFGRKFPPGGSVLDQLDRMLGL